MSSEHFSRESSDLDATELLDVSIDECIDSEDDGDCCIINNPAESLELIYSNDSDSDVTVCDFATNEQDDFQTSVNENFTKCEYDKLVSVPVERQGLKLSAKIQNIDDSFKLFFPKDIVECMVKYSNEEADRRSVPRTNINEVYAYMGILITMGAERDSKLSIDNLWGGRHCRTFYVGVMSRERFRQLTCILKFDGSDGENQQADKFYPVRELITSLNSIFPNYYVPGTQVAIGEILSLFRGTCPFTICMKDKPGKYGVLLRTLADTSTKYILNFEVYQGKCENTTEEPSDAVKRLVSPIAGSGRNLTAGPCCSSIQLAEDLWRDFGLTFVGALKKNKEKLPKILTDISDRQDDSPVFAYPSKNTLYPLILSSYTTSETPKKNVILLSTQQKYLRGIMKDKYELFNFYNNVRRCLDDIDKNLRQYSVKRGTRRWPLSLFYTILDIAAWNASVVYLLNFPEWGNESSNGRYEFLLNLGKLLVKPHVEQRTKHSEGLHRPVINAMEMILDGTINPASNSEGSATPNIGLIDPEEDSFEISIPTPPPAPTPTQTRKRCYICTKNAKLKQRKYSELSKSKQRCFKCCRPVCQKHSKRVISCLKCQNDENDEEH